jgi:pimeloyl-ACP methyl ester carboxylesterase
MAPVSPEAHRWETVWHCMQGGPGGVYRRPLLLPGRRRPPRSHRRDRHQRLPLYLLTGEYDYSASPQDTATAAARIRGAKVTVMKGLGHFPMSENPDAFLDYLRPVLDEIRATTK